ncbi:MAG: peptidylprolyl isomerase [Phycisphaerales bacterium JB061]
MRTRYLMACTGASALLLAPMTLSGCSGQPTRKVGLDQFAGNVDTSAGASAPRTVYTPANPARPEPETIVIRSFETNASAGTPDDQAESTHAYPMGAVYDAKVGDINGRPIIASRFLEELMPRLRAISTEQPDIASWRKAARPVIARKLDDMIRDEVLYREGRSRNPNFNEQGLLFFVEKVREHMIRQSEGSVTLADQRLREQEGVSLDQFIASIERQRVIKEVLDIAAEDYAPVSWLDIQNEYQRRYKQFNPDPTVFFRLISPTSDEALEEIQRRLSEGESFESVASDTSVNSFAPARGGLFSEEGMTITVPLTEAKLISDGPLNEALVSLEAGQWAGPVERQSGRKAFVMLDRVNQQSMSLDDESVQLNIERYLKQLRSEQALDMFVMRLRERANLGDDRFQELVDELMRVAETRVFERHISRG